MYSKIAAIHNIGIYMKTIIPLLTLCLSIFTGMLSSSALANNILIVGDSLSAGYGIQVSQSWPALLQTKLTEEGSDYNVHNASISGQTTAEGLRQMDALIKLSQPKLVVLELGANDGLRGLSISQMQANLQSMISKSLMAKSQVLLLGIKLPNNYGRRYGKMFSASFESLSQQNGIHLVPFMLAPLEALINSENKADYIQADGLHPTAKSQPLLLEHIWPSMKHALKMAR